MTAELILIPFLLAALAWALEYGPMDLRLAHLFAVRGALAWGFHRSIFLDVLGHQAARAIPVLVGTLAFAGAFVPQFRPWRAVLLTLGVSLIVGPALINLMKNFTSQHCPTDVREFGGVVDYARDQAASFWASSRASAGRCLPSGHAGGGFALVALYFAGWASGRAEWRWLGLALGIAAGLVFAGVRMAQGAHFVSATVWSAVVDWEVCAVLFLPLICRRGVH